MQGVNDPCKGIPSTKTERDAELPATGHGSLHAVCARVSSAPSLQLCPRRIPLGVDSFSAIDESQAQIQGMRATLAPLQALLSSTCEGLRALSRCASWKQIGCPEAAYWGRCGLPGAERLILSPNLGHLSNLAPVVQRRQRCGKAITTRSLERFAFASRAIPGKING